MIKCFPYTRIVFSNLTILNDFICLWYLKKCELVTQRILCFLSANSFFQRWNIEQGSTKREFTRSDGIRNSGKLWTFLLVVFGLVWVFLALVRNLLLEWKLKGLDFKKRAVWQLALICLFWCIWKEHNWKTFEDEEPFDKRLKDFFIWLILEWS